VTPLRDGMNLVAKEYIAAQDPQDPGVLVLSKFAGAARQLGTALLVNPHDADELADAMDRALTMTLAERQERWETAWRAIESATPAVWGRNFLAALTRSSLTSPKGGTETSTLVPPARSPITVPKTSALPMRTMQMGPRQA
jgi:trehalose 6-phosphate synthase